MKTAFIVFGGLAALINVIWLVVYLGLQKKIKATPNDEIAKRRIRIGDLISRSSLLFMAIFYVIFKLFGEN
jgi:hypothetical protein